MIGQLPNKITVNGIERPINSDWISCYNIMCMIQDSYIEDKNKTYVMFELLYKDGANSFTSDELQEANDKACEFLNGEITHSKESLMPTRPIKLVDWEQDSSLIFAAIQSISGNDIRKTPDEHWWTFLALFMEIPEKSIFSSVLTVRNKIFTGKRLESYEKEFLKKNKELIYFTSNEELNEEKEEIQELKSLFGL